MRALLVQAAAPPTYWGYQQSLPFIAKGATLPPLGLATLAGLLPERWELRIRDLHLAPLDDADLRWADAVLVTGMLVQLGSMHEVLRRAQALGKTSVVGGPAATTSPDAFPEATHCFRGEAEGRLELLVEALEAPGAWPRDLTPAGEAHPDLALAPMPRFDLLDLDRYATFAIQVSRGCPFTCEFCDIIEIFGRVPRVKAPAQVLAELESLHRLGARGPLFVVDDNFIGNRRAAARLLPEITAWQRAHGTPFDLLTEASLDLATEDALVPAMVEAGFSAVFVGLETPDPDTLARIGKRQNLRVDPAAAIEALTRAGLEVFAGFIVGFDGDDAAALERQRVFVTGLPIPRAMVGLLTALPGTRLWRRLEREGRLRPEARCDQFDRPNFETSMGDEALVTGYRELLAAIYAPEAYYARCVRHLELARHRAGAQRPGSVATLLRVIWGIGVVGPRRRWFWWLMAVALRRGAAAIPRAIALAIVGEHLIEYTAAVVLPRLDRRLAEIRSERRAPRPVPERVHHAARAAGAAAPGAAASPADARAHPGDAL